MFRRKKLPDPHLELEPTIREVQRSTTNCLGERYNPKAAYTVATPENVPNLQSQGWKVVIPKVTGHYGDQYVLMEYEKEPQ